MNQVSRWWKSLFAWRHVDDLGVWRYEENTVTGKRRAIRIAACHGPQHSQWLKGGKWERTRPPPPTGVKAAPIEFVVKIELSEKQT